MKPQRHCFIYFRALCQENKLSARAIFISINIIDELQKLVILFSTILQSKVCMFLAAATKVFSSTSIKNDLLTVRVVGDAAENFYVSTGILHQKTTLP